MSRVKRSVHARKKPDAAEGAESNSKARPESKGRGRERAQKNGTADPPDAGDDSAAPPA